jgi:transposase
MLRRQYKSVLDAWHLKEEIMAVELSATVLASLQLAARKLTGFRRRQFQAEMALRYCGGSSRKAERVFGWGRAAVETGLGELRTGIRCVDDCSSRGRRKLEAQHPQLAEEIRTLVEPHCQADPKFQTTFAYTRITAKAVREQLAAQAVGTDLPVPAERSLVRILNRLGYRLRRVRKTKPQKKFPRPTPSSTTCGTCIRKPPARRKRSGSRSIPRRK